MGNDHKYRRRVIDRSSLRGEGRPGETMPLHRVDLGGVPVSPKPSAPARGTPPESANDLDGEPANSLRITGRDFSLELEGDADFVNSAYDAVRGSIIARLRAAVTGEFRAFDVPKKTSAATDFGGDEPIPAGGYVWVYVCHELYRKVHVVSRAGLASTPLSTVLDPFSVGRIYVDRGDHRAFEGLVGVGKTLWSELTHEGRLRLSRNRR